MSDNVMKMRHLDEFLIERGVHVLPDLAFLCKDGLL